MQLILKLEDVGAEDQVDRKLAFYFPPALTCAQPSPAQSLHYFVLAPSYVYDCLPPLLGTGH